MIQIFSTKLLVNFLIITFGMSQLEEGIHIVEIKPEGLAKNKHLLFF